MTPLKSLMILAIASFSVVSCTSQTQTQSQSEPEQKEQLPLDIASTIDTNALELVELARPNSGTYSYEEAESRKGEIYDMQLSVKHFEWDNPTTGGAIHINKNDEIEIYQFTMGLMYLRDGVNENQDSVVFVGKAPKDTVIVVQQKDIKRHVGGIGFGNAASVLITSEYDLKRSKSLDQILEEVYEPATQIYYLKKGEPTKATIK